MKKDISSFIAIIVLVSGIVATYFQGQSQSKDYVDTKVNEMAGRTDEKLEKIKENVNKTNIDVAVIKQILVQKFGNPKDTVLSESNK